MVVLRVGVLAVVVAALSAAPAAADLRSIPTPGAGIAGPRLAGEDVVWAQAVGNRIVTSADGPGGRRVIDRQPLDGRSFVLEADASRVALLSYQIYCRVSEGCGRYMESTPTELRFRTGPPQGPLADAPGCKAPLLAVGGGAVACGGSVTEADGTVRGYDTWYDSSLPLLSLAGDLVAVRLRDGVRVVRRATGEELLRVQPYVRSFDLAADGTLAYVLNDGSAAWSRPDAPEAHPLPHDGAATDVAVGGGRVALRAIHSVRRSGLEQTDARFTVVDLAGHTIGAHAANATAGSFDFDGHRLAYARRPCLHTTVHVWDVDAPVPDELGGAGCALPVPTATQLRVSRDGGVRLPLSCAPPPEAAECEATVWLLFRWRDRRGRVHAWSGQTRNIELEPGAETTVTIRPRRRYVRRARTASVRVYMRHAFARPLYLRHVLPVRLPPRA